MKMVRQFLSAALVCLAASLFFGSVSAQTPIAGHSDSSAVMLVSHASTPDLTAYTAVSAPAPATVHKHTPVPAAPAMRSAQRTADGSPSPGIAGSGARWLPLALHNTTNSADANTNGDG